MTRRLTYIILIVLLVFIVGGGMLKKLWGKKDTANTNSPPTFSQLADRQRVHLKIGDAILEVEAVTSPESTTLGLSGRSEIGADGMLFVFPTRSILRFWMKDMQFDLDMVWIDDSKIVDITENVPYPVGNQDTLPVYSPKQPASAVLELPAGMARSYGFVEGDEVLLWYRDD
jgi:uncharacterized protein